jgi:hypothetical protein
MVDSIPPSFLIGSLAQFPLIFIEGSKADNWRSPPSAIPRNEFNRIKRYAVVFTGNSTNPDNPDTA